MSAFSPQDAWLWLAISGVTPSRFSALMAEYGDVAGILAAVEGGAPMPGPVRRKLMDARLPANMDTVRQDMARFGISLVTREHAGYPPLLRYLVDQPVALFVRGVLDMNDARTFAIVGSRRCTRYGSQAAQRIAAGVAADGVCVVSGMERGIDSAVHLGALGVGGRTMAVLGCGADIAYPPENKGLIDRVIGEGGSVLTEYPPGTAPIGRHFPARNRIISGICSGVLIAEATETSGAMITVRHALDQGREVYAMPGPVDSPTSVMPLELLREGSQMATRAEDILQGMRWLTAEGDSVKAPPKKRSAPRDTTAAPAEKAPALSPTDQRIVDCLAQGEQPFTALADRTGMSVSDLNCHLTMLELQGIIIQLPGRIYSKAR